jgi:hypothetical protein
MYLVAKKYHLVFNNFHKFILLCHYVYFHYVILVFFVCFSLCCFTNHLYILSKKLPGGFNGIGNVSTSLFKMFGCINLIVEIKLFEKVLDIKTF